MPTKSVKTSAVVGCSPMAMPSNTECSDSATTTSTFRIRLTMRCSLACCLASEMEPALLAVSLAPALACLLTVRWTGSELSRLSPSELYEV